jgi:hypothetical protein
MKILDSNKKAMTLQVLLKNRYVGCLKQHILKNNIFHDVHLYEMLNIPAGSTGRMVEAKPAVKVETKPARQPRQDRPTQDAPKVRTERTRTRTKKFKES